MPDKKSTLRVSLPVLLLCVVAAAIGDSGFLSALGIVVAVPVFLLLFGGARTGSRTAMSGHIGHEDDPHSH